MSTQNRAKQWEGLNGYKPLRLGRIHLRCPMCGRKMSNVPRGEWDPPKAVLLSVPCDKHSGLKVEGGDYYDAQGREFFYDGERYRIRERSDFP